VAASRLVAVVSQSQTTLESRAERCEILGRVGLSLCGWDSRESESAQAWLVEARPLEAAESQVVGALAVASQRPVLAVGEGFAWACERGFLPGSVEPLEPTMARAMEPPVEPPADDSFWARVEGLPTPFTGALPAGRAVRLGNPLRRLRYTAGHADVVASAQTVLRLSDAWSGVEVDPLGAVARGRHRNGSSAGIVAICNDSGTVVGGLFDPWRGTGAEQIWRALAWHLKASQRHG